MLIYKVVSDLQVSRDAETGISRGCGFVTMRSHAEARTATNALDGFVSHTNFTLCVVSYLTGALFYFHGSLIGPGWA